MKIFKKTISHSGRTRIYLCGIKIASYQRGKSSSRASRGCPNPSCDIYCYDDYIKRGVFFPHLVGIVISRASTIGDNCWIYQNVTIGARNLHEGDGKTKENYPTIGENTVIYAGAVVVGPVHVGKNCIIGANSVVINDIPDNTAVAGVPARIIKKLR